MNPGDPRGDRAAEPQRLEAAVWDGAGRPGGAADTGAAAPSALPGRLGAPADTAPAAAGAGPREAGRSAVPCVSVVVPTCGRPDLLRRVLDALQAQTLPAADFEVLVVDDGHDEATRALVQALQAGPARPVLQVLRPPTPRGGPARARNVGWRAARGEVVAFTDDDTVPAPDWLARGLAALRAAPDAAALAGRVEVPPPPGPVTDHARMTQGLADTEFVTANAFVRRTALLAVQGFDERFTRAWREDSDLQFSLQRAVGPVGRVDDAVVLHPVRPERWGVSLRQQKNAFFEALLYAKHPREYRERGGVPVPWAFYGIVALALATAVLALAGIWGSALVAAAVAIALVLRFAGQRLRGTSHDADHVLEMLVTSALIPFLSVYWRLRGAWHWRVWFL